ncbi:hypothetical protein [Mucilaginibacter defluvii]|uniref:hypothetical protein n=1 Tax=Mucilaginibacter defluvii TaxID=1196019 RepID=UPI0031EEE8CF
MWFKKRKRSNDRNGRFYQKINHVVGKIQHAWAGYMGRKYNNLSRKGKIISLALFIGVGVTFSIYRAFNNIGTKLNIAQIQKPAFTTSQPNTPAPKLPQVELKRIRAYHHYLDSLAKSPSGKMLRDSLLARHPGLLDSIIAIEKLYSNQ